MNSGEYWDKKIIEWEDSMGDRKNVSIIEKCAARFRQPLRDRMKISMEMMAPLAEGKTILDLGCGSGYFAFELYKNTHPKQVIGMDISGNAVRRAQDLARQLNLDAACTFVEGDAALVELPAADITVGLGFLDYLTEKEIADLFGKLKSKYFLFSFSEKSISLPRFLHILYMWSQKCPKHFYFSESEILKCIGDHYKNVQFFRDKRLSFSCIVHNLGEETRLP